MKQATTKLKVTLASIFASITVLHANAEQAALLLNDSLFLPRLLDRWQTGSFTFAHQSPNFTFDLNANLLTPSRLGKPSLNGDRPYAEIIDVGVAYNYSIKQFDIKHGARAFFVGKRTKLHAIQNTLHEWIDIHTFDIDSEFQLPNQTWLGVNTTISRNFDTRNYGQVHTYTSGQFGGAVDEIAVGFDWFSSPTKILTRETFSHAPVFKTRAHTFVLGATLHKVFDDKTLNNDISNVTHNDFKYAIRGGFKFRNFYTGLYYLSPVFDKQKEGQMTVGMSWSM